VASIKDGKSMKIGRWIAGAEHCEGWFELSGDTWFAHRFRGTSIEALIESGLASALEILEGERRNPTEAVRLSDIELKTPFDPKSVRDCVAFEQHVEGVVKSIDNSTGVVPEWYEFPTFYFTNPHTLIPSGKVMIPPPSAKLDYELEVGIVVGATKPLSNLTPEQGDASIFGFAIFNDWSARDIQAREMKVRLGPAKGKDFASTLGPWIVTADEFTHLKQDGFHHMLMQVYVNDELIGQDSLANIGWPLGELVAYASRNSIVRPGDLIGTGTAGGGCLAELWGRNGSTTPPPLKTGDRVRMTIEGIGTIENTVGEPVVAPHIPPARTGRRVQMEARS
jgi:2-keto-4-pentenoate hydratase/2-oxohepta-3-ene-1,7-dioic acid hydratase in catechol pathway